MTRSKTDEGECFVTNPLLSFPKSLQQLSDNGGGHSDSESTDFQLKYSLEVPTKRTGSFGGKASGDHQLRLPKGGSLIVSRSSDCIATEPPNPTLSNLPVTELMLPRTRTKTGSAMRKYSAGSASLPTVASSPTNASPAPTSQTPSPKPRRPSCPAPSKHAPRTRSPSLGSSLPADQDTINQPTSPTLEEADSSDPTKATLPQKVILASPFFLPCYFVWLTDLSHWAFRKHEVKQSPLKRQKNGHAISNYPSSVAQPKSNQQPRPKTRRRPRKEHPSLG